MKVFRLVLVCVVVVCCSVGAQASIAPSNLDVTDSGCVVDMSTAGCFSYSSPATTYGGPRATKCVARASDHQRCRECAEAYYNDGQPRGYQVCGYVPWGSSCGCDRAETKYCGGYGECDYSIF